MRINLERKGPEEEVKDQLINLLGDENEVWVPVTMVFFVNLW